MNVQYRQAQEEDLTVLIHMLADDPLGAKREDLSISINKKYIDAMKAISDDPNNELWVVEAGGAVIGMLQLTFIPYLTHIGSWRCLIEGVRIAKSHRGQGLGEQMFEHAIDRARSRGCNLVQLTSDKQRPDALRFYEKLGFVASHEGFKLAL
ncbi:transcriptional regulator [Vibrio maritimus]|uniref:Transcriptional regulator n=1 Tax=Vibrio maritimus TaxID=990268 RepID=A0A090S3B9_9VIBR|nr:transcriptional regulator [Vibrio maritimus]